MIVHSQTNSVLLRVRNPEAIEALIPKTKRISFQGHNLAVRYGLDETRLLRNLNIDVPSPILYEYNWPGRHQPFEHQKETAAFITLNRRGFILSQQGTAKTAPMLWALDYLMTIGQCGRTLVNAPLSTLRKIWEEECFLHVPHRICSVLYASRAKRLQWLGWHADFYIINHDALGLIVEEVIRRPDITALVIDEGDVYRNSQTARWKVLNKLIQARPSMRVWIMTGTPCPQAPTDAWALAKLINPERVPRFFGNFRRDVMLQVSPYKWVPKREAMTRAYEIMQPAVRYLKSECMDLPPLLTEQRETQLSQEQKDAYKIMHAEMMLDIRGHEINAVNAADQINKLRQILCGVIKEPGTDIYRPLDFAPRLDTLLECIRQANAKVLVVVPFKGIIQFLAKALAPHYSCAVINGDVTPRARDRIITEFKTQADPRVLLLHPRVASYGLNLTEADTCVFYAPIYSNAEFQQIMERFNRPGQTRKMTILRIGGHRLEWNIYALLDQRQITQENILSLYRKEVLGV